jgi:predicted nucleic acid-binding protein
VPIVLDANLAIDWFLPTCSEVSGAALETVAVNGAVVPPLWRWEVQDVLRRLDVAKRLKQPVEHIRRELRELPITVDSDLSSLFGNEAAIAKRFGLTLYDAAYLELALRLGAPLATNDRALARAAKLAKASFGD